MNFKRVVIGSCFTLVYFSSLLYGAEAMIEGPDGVTSQLVAREAQETDKPQISMMQSYYAWKKELREESGLSFGIQAIMLYQQAGDTLADREDNGASGIFRFSGSYKVFERDNGHLGRIEWRVENRSGFGSLQSPSNLSGAIGMHSLNSGFAYSDNFDTDLSVINWTQGFIDRGGFAIGRLSFDVYLDAFMFQTYSRAFITRSFVFNPTLPTTGVGALGLVAKGFVTDNILIGAQIYEANAVSGEFDIDTLKENEWLKAVEVAWTPAISRYKLDRVQLTYWHKDARDLVGAGAGSGWAVSASHQVTEQFIPFVRFGHSTGDGGVTTKSALSTGFEYSPWKNHAWSLGAGWAEPKQSELRDEYVFETSYRVQVTPSINLMPDLQYLIDPANNPELDSTWVAGLRCILTL